MLLNPLQARALFAHALQHRYALLAVNADSPAALNDCLEAAAQCRAPIIIEASLWQLTGHSFGAGDPLLGMARYLAHLELQASSDRYRQIPVLFHTDHIKGPQALPLLKRVLAGIPAQFGETAVSLTPSTLSLDSSELTEAENIAAACELCAHAGEHNRSITLEMEAGVDEGVTPLQVTERLIGAVEARYPGCVYLYAPGVGTRHGYSEDGYPTFSAAAIQAHRERAAELTGRPIGIALHGSSGLGEAALRDAVAAGVVKVNWSTESLQIRSAAAREYYTRSAERLERGHPQFKATAMDDGLQRHIAQEYVPRVSERIRLLGGEGMAEDFAVS